MPFLSNGPIEVTMLYDPEPIKTQTQTVTLHYPLPSGMRQLGGRLQRKARLRKKQLKYRLEKKYSFRWPAFISDVQFRYVDDQLEHTVTFQIASSSIE